jgi:CHAT domain-containing protein
MYAGTLKRFGCVECGYFTDVNGNINRHNLTKSHIDRMMTPKVLDEDCKYQCVVCFKKYTNQSSLWSHNIKCKPEVVTVVIKKSKNKMDQLQDQMVEMKTMIENLTKKQQVTSITNNNSINITNNIQVFLNEKCQNAMSMYDFIKGIKFTAENFTKSNLLIADALKHTMQIFEKRLSEMTLYERPMHNFVGEDKHQLIAHYKHNNEWKEQSEISILDEIYRDYEGKEPVDSFVHYLANFHKGRLDYFDDNYDKRNYLGVNLRYTTYPEQQIDLARGILGMAKIDVLDNEEMN